MATRNKNGGNTPYHQRKKKVPFMIYVLPADLNDIDIMTVKISSPSRTEFCRQAILKEVRKLKIKYGFVESNA